MANFLGQMSEEGTKNQAEIPRGYTKLIGNSGGEGQQKEEIPKEWPKKSRVSRQGVCRFFCNSQLWDQGVACLHRHFQQLISYNVPS